MISDIEQFELEAAAEVFDVLLRLSADRTIPVVTTLSTRRLAQWIQRLADLAPVVDQASGQSIQPNKTWVDNPLPRRESEIAP